MTCNVCRVYTALQFIAKLCIYIYIYIYIYICIYAYIYTYIYEAYAYAYLENVTTQLVYLKYLRLAH